MSIPDRCPKCGAWWWCLAQQQKDGSLRCKRCGYVHREPAPEDKERNENV